ncbi:MULTISPECIES: DUF4430 domain-containing protein [unclassified Collinsella]|uniref:DUF4430 domain-containing protein n=1 Tax=unclassified Collinsella TaxID=2637548 RepID=UPI0012B3B41F|nr:MULTISPECIES: DUF4430 domain-containing protein [unclassified Collinsella]MSS25359.1 DUF4430 domain-containing protein [Collinsella sp. WCA1-178-WT-3 (M2)]MSS51745.1 DUF4430 domain-containing protein [Collinsella sp. WCA1-178-WT-3 (M1)]
MGVLERNVRDDVGQPLGNVPSLDNRRQMDMFEDECQRASWRRHGAIACGVAKRGLVAFLAFAMAFGTTPAQLWAEGAEGIAESVAQAATGGEGAAADDGAAAGDTGANGAAASAAADGADAGQGATASAANGDDAATGNATESENSAAAPAASEQKNAVAAASATTLSSEAKVYIQDAKDKDNSYSTKSGALNVGDTLWANMYDEVETEDYWGDPTTETKSVANPGAWTYTWLAGTVKASSDVADYTEVVGHEQSLTITDAMEGKYFICKVTADGKDYYGPSVSYGSGINPNSIPGPVLGAGQMELYSVKLSSDAPSIGDTLMATPYKDWSSPAGSDAKVTYTWSASTSQYSGFTKIEGETGASLTVTDDLEGKYIRVEATAGVNTVSKTTSNKVKQAGAVDVFAVSLINPKTNNSVFAVGDTAQARAKEKGASTFIDANKLNYQWQCSDTKSGTYTDIAGATGETLELTDALGGKYLKCKVSSKIGSSSLTNSTGALVAPAGSINITKVSMSPSSGKVEVGSTITATAKAGSTDVTTDSHVTWQWYKGTSNTASSCNTPIEGETGNTLTVTAALKGYYVVAKANGGYGEQRPNGYYAAGPVSIAGQVELYDVQFEGSPATNGVHVGDTLKTKVRKKDGSSYSYIDRTDNVTYQWQYANSSSSSDSAYTDIPGATEATYTVDAAYAGKYLRVKVTSENTVSSTQKKSSYGQTVAPLGPVTLKGQYKLAGIELADKNVTLSVGSKITPSVQVPGSWSGSTKDVPDDAELTMAWYAKGEGDADWTELTDGIDTTDGSLTISDALVGKRIKVTASALDNTVEWVSSDSVTAAGEYNLLRVIANPQINSDSIHLVSGDSVKATAQAKRADGSPTNGIDVTDQATVVWYAADDAKASAADWTLLSDMSGATATVSASAAGKYLKAVATSGSSTVELVSANPVIAAGSLEAAVQKLNDANKQIAVDYSAKGGNVNDALKAQLADLGFTDIDVKVSEGGVAFNAEDDKATVGISDAQDKTNGDVTFFYIDPNDYTGYNIDGLRSADVVFELSRDGKTEYYQPSKSVQVAWDEARVQQMLDDAAEQVAIGYAAGDSAEFVTSNLTLPYRAGSKSKFEVEWKSTDGDVIWPSGYGWDDYTGKVTRVSSDRTVTLTATVSFVSGGPSDVKGAHDFMVTVKGDPEKVAADQKALQEKVDAAFTYDNIKYSGTETPANKDGLTADLQMPRTSTLNIDGKYYKIEYSASTDDITFNGYKGTVYQPLPGDEAAKTKITLTVTDKSNAEVTASKTLDFAIAPQDQDELDAELSLMEKAKSGYADAILNGQEANAVSADMHAFQKAYLDADGNLAWSYDKATTDSTSLGIVPVDLPGYDAMSGQDWRLFKSSNSSIVSAENLKVTQPQYNTKVVVSSRLTSEKYARYAERYPGNTTYAKLANQDVSAKITVLGTSGQNSPEVTATCSVIGVDAKGKQQTWAAASQYTLTNGSTAADLSEELFKQAGLKADYDPNGSWGWVLNSITSPFDADRTLAYDHATGAYWQLFINGVAASVDAGNYTLEAGDSVVWCYSKYGDAAPTDQLSVSCTVVGQDASGAQQTWAQPTTALVEEGATAADLSEQVFKQAGIGADVQTGSYGWFLNSLTSPFNKSVKLSTVQVNESIWKSWQFFVNGKKANVGAGNYTLKAGDEITWVYGSDGTMPGQVSVSMEIIGKKDDKAQRWTDPSMQVFVEGTTIKNATAAYFDALGIESEMYDQLGFWGVHSLVSPLDGTKLAGAWSFFVNGVPGPQLDSDYVVKSGDTIVWAYAAGDTVPNPDEVVVNPSAPRPTDWKSDWDGKSNAAVENISTPTGALASSWTFDWKAYSGSAYPNASEPIVVNGNVYLAVNKRLLKIDAESGKVLAESNLKTAVGYTSRPIYANGLVIVPLDGGAVQALTADALTTVWVTDSVSGIAQSNSQLTVDGNYLYVGTVDVDYGTSTYNNGHLTRINILTGAVSWQHVNADEGYYWTGATVGDDFVLVPTSAGTVEMLSKFSGDVLGKVSVGAVVNSTCVLSDDGSHAYLISRDGKLHVLAISDGDSRDADAASRITEERVVDLGLTGCACAPTMHDGKLIVGGEANGSAALAIIDLNNDFDTTLVTTADGSQLTAGILGGIKGAPLVSAQADGTYVYFTVNYGESPDFVNYTSGGGVYRYKLGDAEASGVFSAAGHYNCCDSPIACDAQGNLYYINDSGTLFKLTAGVKVSFSAGEGSKVDFQTTAANGSIAKPADPTREGYTFAGWYTDEACTEAYDFSVAVTADMTLYAKWTKNAVAPGGNGGSGSNGSNGGSGNAGAGSGSGNGTNGQQAGGAVAPGQKPVSTTTKTETKDGKDSKKDSGKSDKKDSKKSDKKSGKSSSKSDTGSAAVTTAKKSAEAPAQESGFNPLAIVGVAAGVIGLAVIGVFVFTKRR